MTTDTDYLSSVRHFWHRCTKCAEASPYRSIELKEYIKVNDEIICEGCDPIRFHNLKYGEPLKIQRPSQVEKTEEEYE